MHPLWTLRIYDQYGNTVAHAFKKPNEASQIQGDMVLLAECLPDLNNLNRFFTDPNEKAQAAYTAYAEAWENTYGTSLPKWEEIKSKPGTLDIWKKVGEAASAVDPTMN